jgi:hypothetical protein
MMQWQYRYRRSEADALCLCRGIGKHEIGAGQDSKRIEMMLADPSRMHADLFSIKCLGRDVGDKLVRLAGIVCVVIVAQSKIAKFHIFLPLVLISFERVTDHVAFLT